jgi:3-oxoacyl-[acyl-carrier protein] reductase
MPLDALLVTGGTWETGAFTPDYRFVTCSDEDMRRVIAINLLAPIRLVQAFLPALRAAPSSRVIIIGAASVGGREVANLASKTGLHGACAALREELKDFGIGVTLLNPGNIATPEVLADVKRGIFSETSVLPMSDLLATMDDVLSSDAASVPPVIELTAKPLPRN